MPVDPEPTPPRLPTPPGPDEFEEVLTDIDAALKGPLESFQRLLQRMEGQNYESLGANQRIASLVQETADRLLKLTAIAAIGGLVFGTLLALARLSPIKALATAAAGYVNLMRSIPLVLVIFWFFFLMPEVLQWVVSWQWPTRRVVSARPRPP